MMVVVVVVMMMVVVVILVILVMVHCVDEIDGDDSECNADILTPHLFRFPNNPWSYEACATPAIGTLECPAVVATVPATVAVPVPAPHHPTVVQPAHPEVRVHFIYPQDA